MRNRADFPREGAAPEYDFLMRVWLRDWLLSPFSVPWWPSFGLKAGMTLPVFHISGSSLARDVGTVYSITVCSIILPMRI